MFGTHGPGWGKAGVLGAGEGRGSLVLQVSCQSLPAVLPAALGTSLPLLVPFELTAQLLMEVLIPALSKPFKAALKLHLTLQWLLPPCRAKPAQFSVTPRGWTWAASSLLPSPLPGSAERGCFLGATPPPTAPRQGQELSAGALLQADFCGRDWCRSGRPLSTRPIPLGSRTLAWLAAFIPCCSVPCLG